MPGVLGPVLATDSVSPSMPQALALDFIHEGFTEQAALFTVTEWRLWQSLVRGTQCLDF